MQPLTERRQRLESFKTNNRLAPSARDPGIRMILSVIQRAETRRADELASMIRARKRRETSPQSEKPLFHTVVIKPVGNQCNLQCSYCFNPTDAADDEHGALPVMDEKTLRTAIAESLNAVPDFLHFVWHGGEPLLAGIPFFESAVLFQHELNKKGKTIKNSVQTNGTLINDEWIAFFQRHGFKIGISMDGPEAVHDRFRQYPSGKGSFSRVQTAIQKLQDCKMDFGVIAVITPHMTISPQALFCDFIRQEIYHVAITPCGFSCDFSISPQDYANFSINLFDAWLVEGDSRIQIKPFEDIVTGLFGYSPRICWMSGTCAMFICIEPDGGVWPCCDRTLSSEAYRWGNILDMDLSAAIKSRNAHDFRNADKKRQLFCTNCEWAFLCLGGCVYHRIIHSDAVDAPDPFCPAYQKIFAHIADRIDESLLGVGYG